MLTLEQMLLRLIAAMAIGALVGWERELQGKEAGVRTSMFVASGAAIFAMIGLSLPYANLSDGTAETLARSTGSMNAIANIVIGIGFLGAGIIFREGDRVHGLTTAAVVWNMAAIGIMAGLGMFAFAISAAVLSAIVLYILRGLSIPVAAPPVPPKPSKRRK